jgi:hypothetical protein
MGAIALTRQASPQKTLRIPKTTCGNQVLSKQTVLPAPL